MENTKLQLRIQGRRFQLTLPKALLDLALVRFQGTEGYHNRLRLLAEHCPADVRLCDWLREQLLLAVANPALADELGYEPWPLSALPEQQPFKGLRHA